MSFPAGTDLANRAVEHDENCEWQLAIEHYVRAADVIEYAFNSGQPLPPLPPGHDYPDLVAQYRNRASEIAQDYPQGIGGQPGNNSSAAASTSAAARSMFQKFKSTASKAASKTKETAISAGQTAKYQPHPPPTLLEPRPWPRREHSQTRSPAPRHTVSELVSAGGWALTRDRRCQMYCFRHRFAGADWAARDPRGEAGEHAHRVTRHVQRERSLLYL